MCQGTEGKSLRKKPGGEELGPIGDDTTDSSSSLEESSSSEVAVRDVLVAAATVSLTIAVVCSAVDDGSSDPPRVKRGLDVEGVGVLILNCLEKLLV